MPIYDYACNECGGKFEKMLPMSRRTELPSCPECESSDTQKLVTGCNVNFPGDGWATKNDRISRQMRKKNERLRAKERERRHDAPGMRLAPNVDGVRTDSWADAQKLAKEKGKNTASYEPMIAKEKKGAV